MTTSSTFDDDEEEDTSTLEAASRQQQQQRRRRSSAARRTFAPYTTTMREAPMFDLMLSPWCGNCCCRALVACLYRTRWWLSYPLRTRLWPKCLPHCGGGVPVTVGECILAAPLLVWLLVGYHASYVEHDIEHSGHVAAYALFVTYLTATKANSLFSFLLGIPFERMIPLHQVSAVTALVLAVLHTHAAYEYDDDSAYSQLRQTHAVETGQAEATSYALLWYVVDGLHNQSGVAILSSVAFLVGTSLWHGWRRWWFNAWLVIHVVLAVGGLVGLFVHSVRSAVFVTAWWLLDVLVRYGLMAACHYNIPHATLRRIGVGPRQSHEPAVEISFPKPAGFHYNPGQFVQVCIPRLSIFEFHPISISSAPHEAKVTLHIRPLGDWTSKLVALCANTSGNDIITTRILLEGPYGALSVDVDDEQRYKMALLVSGGIGVTPCQSIGKHLLHQHSVHGRQLRRVQFVWAVRNRQMVHDLAPLGGECSSSSSQQPQTTATASSGRRPSSGQLSQPLPAAVVQVDIYCTQKDAAAAVVDEEHAIINDDDDDNDDGALSKYNVYRGRPDLDAIFVNFKQIALDAGEHSIAVFGCGPPKLMRALEEACRQHSQAVVGCACSGDNGVFFDLHTEHFEL